MFQQASFLITQTLTTLNVRDKSLIYQVAGYLSDALKHNKVTKSFTTYLLQLSILNNTDPDIFESSV